MELRDGIFAVKLCELERQYGLLQTRLELCQGAGHEKIRDILQDELNDYRENALLMERRAEGSRSPAVAELSSAQRDYDRRVEEILREKLPRLMRGEEDPQEEQAEARHSTLSTPLTLPARPCGRPAGGTDRHRPADEL